MNKDPTKRDIGCQEVQVGADNTATVTCPHCGLRYKVNAWKVETRGVRSKLRCKCGNGYSVFFEFRENPRRALHVKGFYRKVEEVHVRGTTRTVPTSEGGLDKMQVQNISRTGIGFVVQTEHDLRVGDKIEVMFTLDDAQRSRIERTAIVRRLFGEDYLGCEFMDVGHFDAATGFYVIT